MALPNLETRKEKAKKFYENEFTEDEKLLVDRLNEAFPLDAELMILLDLIFRKYFKIVGIPEGGVCGCGKELYIQALCNTCDREIE